jgi:hypothetical protein
MAIKMTGQVYFKTKQDAQCESFIIFHAIAIYVLFEKLKRAAFYAVLNEKCSVKNKTTEQ